MVDKERTEGLSEQELEGHDVEQLPEREEMALLTTSPSATVPMEGYGTGDGIVAHDGVPPGTGAEEQPIDSGGDDEVRIQPHPYPPENAPTE